MRFLSFLLALVLCMTFCSAAPPAEDYPADPAGAVVVDRDNLEDFYALLYTRENQSFLDVYRGTPWKRIHHWPIVFQDEKVVVPARSVLHIVREGEGENQLVFFWSSYGGYREGAVHLSLSYDLKTGKWTTNWSD